MLACMAQAKRIVYVLKSRHESPHFYVGVTAAVDDRLADHNAGRCPHTVRYRPWSLHVVIEFTDERTALRFERYLESGSGRAALRCLRCRAYRQGRPVPPSWSLGGGLRARCAAEPQQLNFGTFTEPEALMPPFRQGMIKDPALVAVRLALGALTLAAMGSQLVVHVRSGFPVVNFFSYFTILSNLIAGVALVLGAFLVASRPVLPRWYELVRGGTVVCMAVVGLVFAALLRDVDLGRLLPWVNAVHHYVMPVAVVAEWVLRPPRVRLGMGELLACLVFPLLYVTYVLVRGAVTGWYPYPFLNPVALGSYGIVWAYIAGIAGVFFTVGWLLFKLEGKTETRRQAGRPRS